MKMSGATVDNNLVSTDWNLPQFKISNIHNISSFLVYGLDRQSKEMQLNLRSEPYKKNENAVVLARPPAICPPYQYSNTHNMV